MKVTTVLSTAFLILLPGAIVPAFAQEHEQEKQPEQKQQQAKPAQRQQQAKPDKVQQAQHQQPAKPKQQQAQHAASQQRTKPAQRQQQTKPAQQQAGRGSQPAADHGRIPEDRFRASFGRTHTFRVTSSDFANGSGRFQYGGFWFNAVAPWPVGWLYTDSVYVDYLNGGYFLCNPIHPGVYISINIG
jgi:hypothetical protein